MVDEILSHIAEYVLTKPINSQLAYDTAHYCCWDALGCAMLALRFPECTKHLGPYITNTYVPNGIPVPGTSYRLDPVKAAFDLGTLIRWLDYNDTWLAKEWGHPSDNLGGILIAADYAVRHLGRKLTMRDVYTALIKAYEIQGILAIDNSFNRVGIDHVILVKVASVAVITHLLGGDKQEIINALSQAFIDGHSLRTYRHAPNTGSRKSWAAGDATSRALRLSLMTLKGEMGYQTPLTAKTWGLQDVLLHGEDVTLVKYLDAYVMENILFKISFPAEFHAQTAVECAIKLHPQVKGKWQEISKIEIETQEPGVRIISKQGPLQNPADRDHCIQYMVAIPLIYGDLKAEHYEDNVAANPLVDQLREKMHVVENKSFTKNYYDLEKRGIGNAIVIHFKDGTSTPRIEIEYPIGHRLRREEGLPHLINKCEVHFKSRFPKKRFAELMILMRDSSRCAQMSVLEFQELLAV